MEICVRAEELLLVECRFTLFQRRVPPYTQKAKPRRYGWNRNSINSTTITIVEQTDTKVRGFFSGTATTIDGETATVNGSFDVRF